MTENEAIDKLNNLHYKIVHTSFCNKVYESEIESLCMAKDCLKEIQQYRAIGTIEEFKALKEKSVAKKVEIKPWSPARCPACGYTLSESQGDGYYSHPTFLERCPIVDCGQKLDWE